MKATEFLELMSELAKEYRNEAQDSLIRNNHMNEIQGDRIPQKHIDAVLVDFINHCGMKNGVDYALYTKDLEE